MTPKPPGEPGEQPSKPGEYLRPGETFLQADINRSLEFRKDYYKYTLGIATALLAFTISFQPTLRVPPEQTWLEFVGWAGLGVAVAAGIRVHMSWAKFFATFRKYDNKGQGAEGDAARGPLVTERKIMDAVQMAGLVVGVIGVVAFTAVNLKNVALKGDETPAAASVPQQGSPLPSGAAHSPPANAATIPDAGKAPS